MQWDLSLNTKIDTRFLYNPTIHRQLKHAKMATEELKLYAISYATKSGGSALLRTTDISELKKKIFELMKLNVCAEIWTDGVKTGGIFEDLSQRTGWGYKI